MENIRLQNIITSIFCAFILGKFSLNNFHRSSQMIKKISNPILYLLQGLGVILLILLCFSSYFWNDDFYFYNEMEKVGNWKTSYNMYMTWDGRGLSLNGFIRNISVYQFSAYVNSLIATMYLVVQALLIWKITLRTLDFQFSNSWMHVQGVATFTFLLWLIYRSHIAYSHYWATGVIYAIQSIFFLGWIYLYFFQVDRRSWILSVVTFILVLGGVYSAAGIFVLVSTDYIFFKKRWDRRLTLLLLTFIPPFLFNVLAPGNYLRLEFVQGDPITDFTQITLNYFQILKRFVGLSIESIMAALLISIGIPVNGINLDKIKHHKFWLLALVGALASLLPFAMMPNTTLNYLGMHFQVLIFIVVLTFGVIVKIKLDLVQLSWQSVQALSVLLFLLIGYNQWIMSRDVYRQIELRHITLSRHHGLPDTVFLPAIAYKNYFFSHLSYEIHEDPKEAHNLRLQFIYQTGPIVLKRQRPTSLDSTTYKENYILGNFLDEKFFKSTSIFNSPIFIHDLD